MKIRLNGDSHDLAGPMTITELLEQLGIDPRRVAVEYNLSIIKRDRYPTTTIGEGDTIEIVNFVGGGCDRTVQGAGFASGSGSGCRVRTGTEPERGTLTLNHEL